jgi:hypothetical protein
MHFHIIYLRLNKPTSSCGFLKKLIQFKTIVFHYELYNLKYGKVNGILKYNHIL